MTDHSSDSTPSSARQQQFDEILADLMRAIDAGESVDMDRWITAHPEFTAELREFFVKHERVEKLVRPLRQAAANVLHVRCPHCHNPIELLEDAPLTEISCPSCGSSFSLVGEKTKAHFPAGSKTIGHFELLDHVGIGQFGSVWKARDTKLDRTVAVKIPRHGQLDEPRTEMFLRDARAAAQLKHPNIVSVHEVGKQDDTIYIVSDFIQGATLKEWADAKRLTPRESAELCVKIAKALHHAHEAGVIHRDLKPGNIMIEVKSLGVKSQETRVKSQTDSISPALDSGPSTLDALEPHIVDFGLAKRETGEITMTVEGQILGTPAYMSPEQARGEGHTVDCRADIYSLGVILFELLTGELPFRGDKQMLLVQILKDDPPSLRKLNSGVPRDLATICSRCLEKEPQKRYTTSWQLAEELERYLAGAPIQARPISRAQRTWRWCRRNPVVATLVGITTLAAAVVIATLAISNMVIRTERDKVTKAHTDLRKQHKRVSTLLGDLNEAREELAELDDQVMQRQRQLYFTQVKLAHGDWLGNNIPQALQYLDEAPELERGWLHHYLKSICQPTLSTFTGQRCVALSADGSLLASAGKENVIRLRDLSNPETPRILRGHSGAITCLAFSSNGEFLASGSEDQTVKLWRVATREEVHTFRGHHKTVHSVAFSPDSRLLASAPWVYRIRITETGRGFGSSGTDARTIIWNLRTLQQERQLAGHAAVAFSPDGRLLATGNLERSPSTKRHSVVLWDVLSGAKVRELHPVLEDRPLGPLFCVTFSPDGQHLATATGSQVFVFDLTGENVVNFPHENWVNSVRFFRHGEFLASGGEQGLLRIWDMATSRNIRTFHFEERPIQCIDVSQNGRWMAWATERTIQLWKHNTTWKKSTASVDTKAVYCVALSANGKLVAAGGGEWKTGPGELSVWEHMSGRRILHDMSKHKHRIFSVSFSPDNKLLATASEDRTIKVWDLNTGQVILDLAGGRRRVNCVRFSHDGKLLASGTDGGHLILWDIQNGTKVHSITISGPVDAISFSPDGHRLYAGGARLIAWNTSSRSEIFNRPMPNRVWRLAVSPDGKRLALGLDGRRTPVGKVVRPLCIVDADTGEEILRFEANGTHVYDVAFSPDGKLLASAGEDHTVRVLGAATGQAVLELPHHNQVFALAFSPDGKYLVTGSGHWKDVEHGDLTVWSTTATNDADDSAIGREQTATIEDTEARGESTDNTSDNR